MHLSTASRTTRLVNLPYDVLLEIAKNLYEQDQHFRTKHFRSLYALSRVNHRLREVVLPLLWRDLFFTHRDKFVAFLNRELVYGERNPLKSSLKHIRIGRIFSPWFIRPPRTCISNELCEEPIHEVPFPSLTSFECTRAICDYWMTDALSQCPHLTHIDIAWDDDARTPLRKLPNISSARIVLVTTWGNQIVDRHRLGDPSLTHRLTSLALYDRRDERGAGSIVVEDLLSMKFPNLHNLVIDGVKLNTSTIFIFIHNHPTILEATIVPVKRIFRLEALLTLIDGTGTWDHPQWDDESAPVRVHQLHHQDYDPDRPLPANIASVPLAIQEFAFARTPISPDATQWRSPKGSSEPRYRCTALSFMLLPDPDARDHPEDYSLNIQDDILNGLAASGAAASISELRVFADEDLVPNLHDQIFTWIDDLTNALTVLHWPKLRKLAIYWCNFARDLSTDWGSDEIYHALGPALDGRIPILDYPDPPWCSTYTCWDVMSLERLKLRGPIHLHKIDVLESGIREVLGMEKDAELDQTDPNLLVRAWEARNEHLFRRMVKCVADECSSLEEFDWWLQSDGGAGRFMLWHWDIRRNEDGQVKSVKGKLIWTGHREGCMPPKVGVGSALKSAIEGWKRGEADLPLLRLD